MNTPEAPSVTLIEFADALVSALAAKLPDIPTISADAPPRQNRSLRVPAIYLEMADFSQMQAAGDSRLLTDVRWEARCLVDPNLARADLMLRALVGRVVVALHDVRRPVPGHGHLRLVQAGPDAFRPEVEGYLCWVVEFGTEIALGELEPEGITPSEIYLGTSIAGGIPDAHERIA